MAKITEVYGDDYFRQANDTSIEHMTSLFVSNIVGLNLNFRQDSACLWEGANMKEEAIRNLVKEVPRRNSLMRLTHISKTSGLISKIFPYSINGPVEYFVLVDLSGEKIQMYSLYITPNQIEPF